MNDKYKRSKDLIKTNYSLTSKLIPAYLSFTEVISSIIAIVLLSVLYFIFKPFSIGLYLFLLILFILLSFQWIRYFYFYSKQGLERTGRDATKWVEERRKKGKNPYVHPLLFGIGFGVVFCLMFFYLYHFYISGTITNPLLAFSIVFVSGFILGYIAQLRNIRIIEAK